MIVRRTSPNVTWGRGSNVLKALSLLLVAAPVLAFAWAYGGSRASALAAVMPWASFASAVGLLFLPQRHPNEGWRTAERRVLLALVKDPLLWVSLVFFLYLLIPLFNVSLCPVCDWQAIDAGANPYPPYRYLPFCANRADHVGVLWWFGPVLLGTLAVRHGLTRSGKREFVHLFVWNAVVLAVLGFVQMATGARFPFWGTVPRPTHFFSVFGYPNMGGAYFTLAYALSLGLWFSRMGEVESRDLKADKQSHPFLEANYPFVTVALCLAGVLATLSRAAIILVVALTAFFFFYVILRAFSGNDWRRARRFRSMVVAVSLMLAMFGAVYVYAPPEVGREIGTVNPLAVADRVSGKAQYHTRVASAIMRDFPFFGVGGWGYRHFSQPYMTPREVRQSQGAGGANVHNDYLQFLAEHGLVGFALLVACVWLTVLPTGRGWRQLALQAIAAERSGMGASTFVLFAISPVILWTALGCIAVLVHAFGDCPFRSGAVLSAFLSVLAASFGFLPHKKDELK